MLINRFAKEIVDNYLEKSPVVTIIGPRQCGKTTLAKEYVNENSVFFDIENPLDSFKMEDPLNLFRSNQDKLIIIDEAQLKPDLFPIIRVLVDEKRVAGRFLLLGSATPDLRRQSSESLAGRNAIVELTPFVCNEVKDKFSIRDLWLKGGFPESLLSDDEWSFQWRLQYITNLIERDLNKLLGFDVNSMHMLRFIKMMSVQHGQIFNASQYAKSMSVSVTTIFRYIEMLEQLFFVRKLEPVYKNLKKRLIKSPKIYFRDTGLLHSMLNIREYEKILEHPILGFSWEGFVIEQIISKLRDSWDYGFWRTSAGAEIDLVLSEGNVPKIAIEIKANSVPRLEKGFYIACEDLEIDQKWVLYPGKESFDISDGVKVLCLEDALERL